VIAERGGLLVIDKPSGCVVHGEPEAGDLVTRLGARPSEGSPTQLGVHQRLDKGASGVMALSTDAEGRDRLARAFESHDVERRYAVVVRGDLRGSGTLRDQLETDPTEGSTRVVTRGGKPAVAHYRVARRVGDRALVELSTETGRTHQLRVQLAHRGAPVCGDERYGGEWAPRLMLHALRLGLPGSPAFESPMPAALSDWLESGSLALGDAQRVEWALRDAASRRWPLGDTTEAFRLVDDAADDLPGVVVEVFGDHAVLAVRSADASARAHELARALSALGFHGVYLKHQLRADRRRVDDLAAAPPEPIVGRAAPEPMVVRELGRVLAVRLGEGHSTGLFLDQRDNRQRIADRSAGRRVLNLFCYTGSFTVAAAAGGASSTVSVDLSKRALARLQENLELNALTGDHRVIADDVMRWLPRAVRRGSTFDVVVLDPPSFGTRGKKVFSVVRDYARLATESIRLLSPGGTLLAVTNHQATGPDRLRKILHEACRGAGREVRGMRSLPMPLDFPHRPEGRLPTKSVLVTLS
jgi:23S rRNA (cytosine1962-C5)-methyltransferase